MKEKKQKRDKIIEKYKVEVIAIKCQIYKEIIGVSSKKKGNYNSDIKDNTNPN